MSNILRMHRSRSLLKNLWRHTNPYWKIGYEDSRTLGLTEVDVDDMVFAKPPVTRNGEIILESWLTKINASGDHVPLSAQVGFSLRRRNSIHHLEYLRLRKGITEMDFPGTIFRDPQGVNCILRLWHSRVWNYCFWSHRWPTSSPSVVIAKIRAHPRV